MFLGHFATAYAAKRLTPRTSLGTLWAGGPRVGLGLWNSVPATVVVELPMFAAGLSLALSVTRARDTIGRWGFEAVGWAGLLGSLLLLGLAVWVDRQREP